MTTGILAVFRGSNFFSNAGVGQNSKNLSIELYPFSSGICKGGYPNCDVKGAAVEPKRMFDVMCLKL